MAGLPAAVGATRGVARAHDNGGGALRVAALLARPDASSSGRGSPHGCPWARGRAKRSGGRRPPGIAAVARPRGCPWDRRCAYVFFRET
jgi:hypothetical protein